VQQDDADDYAGVPASMPLNIADLKVGDRVILNCPKSARPKRAAQFEGIYYSIQEAMGNFDAVLLPGGTAEFLSNAQLGWAAFLMQTQGGFSLRGAFRVEADGGLREEEGRRIFIERRIGRVGVG
jgi:hypothetical protein